LKKSGIIKAKNNSLASIIDIDKIETKKNNISS